ncbi:Fc.00g080660.m01.CDS01 [Cosmosporella sp. VM-42]
MPDPIKDFGLKCPKGGNFYICDEKPNRFIGCCSIDPCKTDDGRCPKTNLRAATFDAGSWDIIPEQACILDQLPNVNWYTCNGTSPPFIGCCGTNPCSAGCSTKDLRGARLSSDTEKAQAFLGYSTITTSSVASSTTSAIPSTASTDTSSSTSEAVSLTTSTASETEAISLATDAPAVNNESEPLSKGAVAGIAVASTIVGLLFLSFIIFWLIKKTTKERSNHDQGYDHEPFPVQSRGFDDTKPLPPPRSNTPQSHALSPKVYAPTPQSRAYFHHQGPRYPGQFQHPRRAPPYDNANPGQEPPSRSMSVSPYHNSNSTTPIPQFHRGPFMVSELGASPQREKASANAPGFPVMESHDFGREGDGYRMAANSMGRHPHIAELGGSNGWVVGSQIQQSYQ